MTGEQLLSAMSNTSNTEKDNQVSNEPEFRAFRKRVLTGCMIIGLLGLPIGFALNLPYVWIMCILGLVGSSIKLSRIKDSWLTEILNRQNRKIPNLLWIALVSGAIMVLIKIAIVSKAGPLILIDAAITAITLIGLYLGHKWAYIATIILVLLGTLSGYAKDPMYGLEVFCIDGLVLVPVLFCTKYFFPESNKNQIYH